MDRLTLVNKDKNIYEVNSPIEYTIGTKGATIVVPKGFKTNLASVPKILEWIIPHDGKYWRACVLHDYLYSEYNEYKINQSDADKIFKNIMIEDGVDSKIVKALYSCVFTFGGSFYKDKKINGDIIVNKTALIDRTNDYIEYRKYISDVYGDI